MIRVEDCSPCPPRKACAAGTGGPNNPPVDCYAGYYCPEGTTTPDEFGCPAGRYGSETGLSDASCSGPCEQGYWCEKGSVSAKAAPCDEGTYGDATGLTLQANCTVCPAGHACLEAATGHGVMGLPAEASAAPAGDGPGGGGGAELAVSDTDMHKLTHNIDNDV